MSTIKTVRIKTTEAEQLELWVRENKKNMKRDMTYSEIVHHFIYIGLCKMKIDEKGNIVIK